MYMTKNDVSDRLRLRLKTCWSTANVVTVVLFLGPALSMVAPSIYPQLGLILASIGLLHWLSPSPDLSPKPPTASFASPFLAVWALILFGTITLLENLYHGERWVEYHIVVAILLLWPSYFACSLPGVQVRALWSGSAIGAVVAFSVAAFQVFYLGYARASGSTNAIAFGNISLVLAMASFVGMHNISHRKLRQASVLSYLTGGLAGIGASLLSGSKSGWLSLLIIGYVSYRLIPRQISQWKKWMVGLCAAAALVALISLPQSPVGARLKEGWIGLSTWLTTGEVVEGSVGLRLEMWKFGIQVALEKPILGFGRDGMFVRKEQAVAKGEYPKDIASFITLHNEFINIWVAKGLVGTLALISVYGSAFLVFFRIRKSASWQLKYVSLMGTGLVLMFLEFGVGEVALQMNAYRHAFLFWIFALTGLTFRMLQDERSTTDRA